MNIFQSPKKMLQADLLPMRRNSFFTLTAGVLCGFIIRWAFWSELEVLVETKKKAEFKIDGQKLVDWIDENIVLDSCGGKFRLLDGQRKYITGGKPWKYFGAPRSGLSTAQLAGGIASAACGEYARIVEPTWISREWLDRRCRELLDCNQIWYVCEDGAYRFASGGRLEIIKG